MTVSNDVDRALTREMLLSNIGQWRKIIYCPPGRVAQLYSRSSRVLPIAEFPLLSAAKCHTTSEKFSLRCAREPNEREGIGTDVESQIILAD
jgi:hypothetical protein